MHIVDSDHMGMVHDSGVEIDFTLELTGCTLGNDWYDLEGDLHRSDIIMRQIYSTATACAQAGPYNKTIKQDLPRMKVDCHSRAVIGFR